MQFELTTGAAPWRPTDALPIADVFRQMVVDLSRVRRRQEPSARRRCSDAPSWKDRAAWLRSLPPEIADTVAESVVLRRVAAGQHVVRAGDDVPGWIGVVEGFATTEGLDSPGPESAIGLPRGTWYGEQEMLLDGRARHSLSAPVCSTIAVLPRASFDALVDREPAFARVVLQIQAQRSSAMRQQMQWPRRPGTNAYVGLRIASLFCVEAFYDGAYHVALTQSALSTFIGLSRQRTNEALNRLRRLDEVELVYGGVRVKNPSRLLRRALQGDIT